MSRAVNQEFRCAECGARYELYLSLGSARDDRERGEQPENDAASGRGEDMQGSIPSGLQPALASTQSKPQPAAPAALGSAPTPMEAAESVMARYRNALSELAGAPAQEAGRKEPSCCDKCVPSDELDKALCGEKSWQFMFERAAKERDYLREMGRAYQASESELRAELVREREAREKAERLAGEWEKATVSWKAEAALRQEQLAIARAKLSQAEEDRDRFKLWWQNEDGNMAEVMKALEPEASRAADEHEEPYDTISRIIEERDALKFRMEGLEK